MFIICKKGVKLAINSDHAAKIYLDGTVLRAEISGSGKVVLDNAESASGRFDDIIEAMIADKEVYDCTKDVGYWKTPKRSGRPKKTEAKAEPKAEE